MPILFHSFSSDTPLLVKHARRLRTRTSLLYGNIRPSLEAQDLNRDATRWIHKYVQFIYIIVIDFNNTISR